MAIRYKREITILLGTLATTVAIVGGSFWLLQNRLGGDRTTPPENISSDNGEPPQTSAGSRFFFEATTEKDQAARAFADGDYARAETLWQQVLQQSPNDPEAVIYRNNARLLAEPNREFYTLAVAVPVRVAEDRNKAAGILRGVAQVQTEVNESATKLNGKALKIAIADDANSLKEADRVARILAKDREIIAAIGHYTSETTEAALPVYQDNQMVLMSASSTSDTFTEFCQNWGKECVFFRTIANNQKSVNFFTGELVRNARRASIFYSAHSDYSQSFRDNFYTLFPRQGGTVVDLDRTDLAKPGFDPVQVLQQADGEGVEGLVLVPDGGTSAASLRNAIGLIEANQGQLWIAGSSSLYNPAVLAALEGKPANLYNTFVAYTPWHHTTGCKTPSGQQFCAGALQLWGTTFLSWRTATAYDATRALVAALEQLPEGNNIPQLRQQLREILADPDFATQGATGLVAFDRDTHNRANPPLELVRIRSCPKVQHGLAFVPIEYNSAEEAGLKCS